MAAVRRQSPPLGLYEGVTTQTAETPAWRTNEYGHGCSAVATWGWEVGVRLRVGVELLVDG